MKTDQAAHANSGWRPQEWKGQGHEGEEAAAAAGPTHEANEWGIEVHVFGCVLG